MQFTNYFYKIDQFKRELKILHNFIFVLISMRLRSSPMNLDRKNIQKASQIFNQEIIVEIISWDQGKIIQDMTNQET